MAEKRPPNQTTVTPAGDEIEFWDAIGVNGKKQTRRYRVNGEKFVSVSTIVGCLDKPGLPHWAARLTREGKDWIAERDIAAARGVQIHALIERLLNGEKASLADLDDTVRVWGQAAYRWIKDTEPDIYLTETMVAWPAMGYAGRLDLVAEIKGVSTLVDFKTRDDWRLRADGTKEPPYESNLLQLELYKGALAASGYEAPDQGLIVRLGPDGTYDETFCELDPERGLAILRAHGAKREASYALRRARKGEPELEAAA